MNNKNFILEKMYKDEYDNLLSKFKEGDDVKIYREVGPYYRGWNNGWTPGMTSYVGSIGKIIRIADNRRGIRLSVVESYCFPPQSLEKI